MEFLQPETFEEALELVSRVPDARPIHGGTDLLVELNFDRSRPETILDLSQIDSLAAWDIDGDGSTLTIGAGVTCTQIIHELSGAAPGLAIAARTVGSPQIRNRATVGGNLGTASPAGDLYPPLIAAGAEVLVRSQAGGARTIPVCDFVLKPKHSAMNPGELIEAVRVPVARGSQQFSKIGTRNAMVISVASCAVALNTANRTVGVGIGSAGPTPIRARQAEALIASSLEVAGLWDSKAAIPDSDIAAFAAAVSSATSPIDDVRGTAAYRRRAVTVMARRTLTWAWTEYQAEVHV